MAREKDGRYATSLDVAEDLQAYLDGRVVRAYETGVMAEVKKWVARNQAMAAVLVRTVLLAVAATVGLVWMQDKARVEALRSGYVANLIAALPEDGPGLVFLLDPGVLLIAGEAE